MALSFLGALSVRAQEQVQDVGEAARQEKARKAAQAQPRNHVYTNDDLKRSKILTPEQRARIEARKKNLPAAVPPSDQPAQSLDATNSNVAPAESLGDVARRFRREKAARQAEQALKVPPRSGFPMNLSRPSLAAPAPLRAPLGSAAAPPLKSARPPMVIIAPAKRDPFARPLRVPLSSPQSRAAISATPSPARVSPVAPVAPVQPPAVAAAPPNKAVDFGPISVVPKTKIAPAVAPTLSAPSPTARIDSRAIVTVRSGDSLWKISRQHFGKGARWPEWLAANPELVDPGLIRRGATLFVPQTASTQEATRESARPLKISVQKGDSLWKIANTHLGSGTYWHCLADGNPQLQDADHIYPGQSLTIPASCRLTP
ncbi:MAG TPA: LysM peptidoglycan-binding domain-containing protein [Candidatus Dormibacteraeota bacterium]|nr:LysM peptidoglycan-binding domain-containing protein [Candidatus Dormibacteraeota bacterium]